ncbi:MAG: hypothetical protein KZQ64_04420 [gamma proteobacterium symbiont of Bathyaustriella thionipta]|nr:hypothetical protein [gamma proteobacterium symbiont of Bathyaustriella thionipta]MCU7948670.1 hypothetical protein [gamma proteobacterium symbiont of Bathyaustriella thionipta]MCU7952624.1 hypothetical protein [gamma proteobacterium symbiont of Bathyaustriella thionipta]MCU7955121.1 hypothetical protein [gamma proteobacterium symbiont of Bathyaustriella thionipta]MCU7967181.1 hypothetical protein [gamma proteobacterium symbiont of Bathyaustriella thionipta]
MFNTILKTADKHIYITTALLSLLISLWLFASRDIISRDAVLYVTAAQAFLDGGLGAAFKVWAWPFYSIAIAITHQLTGLNLEYSAYVLTILLETVISVTFVKIYSKIAFDGARLWVATLFILSFVTLNDYKGDIWREYGFWAFSLMAIYQFILFYQSPNKVNALLWQLCIFTATLFRTEAIVFAALAPFYFLFIQNNTFAERIKNLLTLNSVFYSIALIAIIIFLLSSQLQELILNNLPPQIVYLSPKEIFGNFNLAADNFVKHVLPYDYSAGYSHLIIGSGLLSMLIFKLIKNFSLIYLGIWLMGSYKNWINKKQESTIIYYFAAIALLILLVFITTRLFVSTRYTVFLLLLIGLIFSQYLDYFLSYLSQQKYKLWLAALSIFIALQFLDSIISTGAKKFPIQHSSEWLIQNSKPDDKIACNEGRFTFYTKHNCKIKKKRFRKNYNQSDIQYLKNNHYRYLLLWVKHKNTTMLNSLEQDNNLILLKQFKNKRDDVALVFKIKN